METPAGEIKAPESVETTGQTGVNDPWQDEYTPSTDVAASPAATEEVVTETTPPQEEQTSAETLNTETVPGEEEGRPQREEKPPPGPIPYERFKEVIDKTNSLTAQVEQSTRMAEFYQTQYNELVAQTQGAQPQQVAAPGQREAYVPEAPNVPAQLPPGVKGPGEWETQDDMAAYYDHVATNKAQSMAQNMLSQAYQSTIVPQMQSLNKWVGALEEMVVKSTYKDFDEVTQSAMGELFVTDHEGKIWTDPAGNPKVKNPALLQYIRQSPMPRKALYDYALSKKAPDKIAETVKTTTQQLLKAIDTKPKGPTVPKQTSGDNQAAPLDWNTAPEVVDQYLKAHGIS